VARADTCRQPSSRRSTVRRMPETSLTLLNQSAPICHRSPTPPPADHRSNHPEDPWDASPPTLEIMGIIWSPPTFATGRQFSVPQTSRLNLRGEGKRIMEGRKRVKHGRNNNGTIASSSYCPVQLRNPDITHGLSDDS